jgi:hypothetical protein
VVVFEHQFDVEFCFSFICRHFDSDGCVLDQTWVIESDPFFEDLQLLLEFCLDFHRVQPHGVVLEVPRLKKPNNYGEPCLQVYFLRNNFYSGRRVEQEIVGLPNREPEGVQEGLVALNSFADLGRRVVVVELAHNVDIVKGAYLFDVCALKEEVLAVAVHLIDQRRHDRVESLQKRLL